MSKRETMFKDTHTGEILAVCSMSDVRARALVKAYRLAGLWVEAVTL